MLAPTARVTDAKSPPAPRRLLRRVLESDPGQEYLVYVPRGAGERAPLLVTIHGTSRNAEQHARLLSAYCDIHGAMLLAPVFSAEQFPDYQRLGRQGRGRRADLALNAVVAECAAATGASAERFLLFGYSGGAQFAHRYLMAHPHRVEAAVIAGCGWYTFPDPTRRFPFGTRMSRKLPEVHFDAEGFLSVPVTVMIGAEDDERDAARRHDRLDREQGASRIERARNWVAAMQAAAEARQLPSRVAFEEIAGCGHSFRRAVLRGGLGEKVFRALFGEPPLAAAREG